MDGSPSIAALRFGGFTLDLIRGALLTAEGHEVALRPKSFALLRLFVEHAGRLLDRDTIMRTIWPDVVVADDGVVQCVRDIRHALGDEAHSILKTLPRRGYIFTAEVTAAVPAVFASLMPSVEDDRIGAPARMQGRTHEVPPFCLVVKPFANWSGHPEDKRLAASLTEDLVTDLARLPAMFVVDSDIKLGDANRLGGICYVVTGGVRRDGRGMSGVDGKLWITIRLADAESGVLLWGDRFSIDLSKTEQAWDEMIGRLVRALEFSVNSSVATYGGFEIGSSNPAAVFCLRGWALLQQTQSPSVWHRARTCFEQALAMDPGSADAKIGKVIVSLGFRFNFWEDPRQEDEAHLEQLLVEAIDCGGLSGRAHLATGMLRRLQDRMPESKMALQVAIASDPSDARAIRQFGYTLAHSGETEAAAVEIEKSLRLNPYDGGVAVACQMLGHCHLLLDDPESSVQYFRASIARNPWLVSTHVHLAAALASSRELSEARATVGRALSLKPEWRSVAAIRRSLPYTNPRYLALMNDGFFAGLRRAGMPEQ